MPTWEEYYSQQLLSMTPQQRQQVIAAQTPKQPIKPITTTYSDGGSTYPSQRQSETATEQAPSKPESPEVTVLNAKVSNYETKLAAYNNQVNLFQNKWSSYIQGDSFTGSNEQYQEYQREYRPIHTQEVDLALAYRDITSRSEYVQRQQEIMLGKYVKVRGVYVLKEDWQKLPQKYQIIANTQGFDVMNSRIQTDNKSEIHNALVQRFDSYLKDDGRYDLAKAVKDGIGSGTIAVAFGSDVAKKAVLEAGPPPREGWGPKAPTLPYAVGVVTSETLFPPAKQWVEPELHYKATGMDWAVGVAQIALFALPAVGAVGKAGMISAQASKGISFGVQAGATAVFTKDTVDNWKYMNNWQRAFSIGLDALIAGSALRSGARLNTQMQIRQLNNIEAQARKIVVDHYIDSATGRIEYKPKPTFRTVPVQPAEAGVYLPAILEDTSNALRNGDTELLRNSGRRMRLLAQTNPESPMSKLLESRGKELENHAEDYIKMKEKPVSPEQKRILDESIKSNKQQAEIIERQLKKGIRNPETEKVARQALEEAKRQVKVAEREAIKPMPKERVIMPEEQGKSVPATKKEAPLTTKQPAPKKEPRIKSRPKYDSDIQVTIRPAQGGNVYVGYVSFPTSDPEGQRQFLEALRNTTARQGYVVLYPKTIEEIKPHTELEAEYRQGILRVGESTRVNAKSKAISGEAIAPATRTKLSPGEQPQTETKIVNQLSPYPTIAELTLEKPQPAPETKEKTAPEKITPNPVTTATDAHPVSPIRLKITTKLLKKRLTHNITDSEKRRLINEADTKAAWIQGRLHNKPVVHVLYGTRGEYEHAVLLGAPPAGVPLAEGKGQAYRSMTLTHGIPPDRPVKVEGGAIDPTISPITGKRGVRIDFLPDETISRVRKSKPKNVFRERRGTNIFQDLGGDIIKTRRGRHLRLY